jgi:hypothetical protein
MYPRQNFYRQQHWQLAERQRYLTELESLAERLRVDVERMNGEIEQAGGAAETGRIHGVFIRPLINRRDKLQRSVAEIDTQIADARAAVEVAQQEMRLVEGPLGRRGAVADDIRPTRRVRPR